MEKIHFHNGLADEYGIRPAGGGDGTRVTAGELHRLHCEAVRISILSPAAVSSLLTGTHRSVRRGRGLDFHGVRRYERGDDFRSLDWRVTARTGKLHTKIYYEEKERHVIVVVDAGSTMHFGTRKVFKWVTAARTAALLSWLAVEEGHRLGWVVFGDGSRCHEHRPVPGRSALPPFFRLMEGIGGECPSQRKNSSLSDALAVTARMAPPDSLVVVVSDFTAIKPVETYDLARLAVRGDATLFFIYDPMEAGLPEAGLRTFSDGERFLRIDTSDKTLRDAFSRAFEKRLGAVRALCRRHGVRLAVLSTEDETVKSFTEAILDGKRGIVVEAGAG